jgi:hypothetical protein
MEGDELRRIMQVQPAEAVESPDNTPLPPGIQ